MIKLKVSYETAQELDELLRLLKSSVFVQKVQRAKKTGLYNRTYIYLTTDKKIKRIQ